LLLHRYDLAFLKADKSAMENAKSMSSKDPVADEWLSQHESSVLAYSGNLKAARKSAHRAMELAQQASHPESAALYQSAMAVWEGFLGNAAAARQNANSALKLSNDRGVEYGAALALALAGDTSRAQQLANDLEKRFPEDTSVQISYLPSLRARIALNQGDSAKAVDLLQVALPYELSVPRTSIHANFGALYPAYMRGEAFLAEHKGTEAAAEFQRILDNRGIALSDPIGALSHLQLGRAYAIAGDKIKARSTYQDFLILWKYADPETPVLQKARAEYGKLK
jgi:hypothetical protein